jgi:hypothetical protein
VLELDFEGWWQCRFATDPDPTDDPRGVSGPTFTVAGEPPLDRIIRFQHPVSPRFPHEHDVGVSVRAARVGGEPAPDHPLIGAAVELCGGAQFHQRNLVLVEQAFQVIVDPFDLRIARDGLELRRAALWDVTHPDLTFEDVFLEPTVVAPRLNQIETRSAIVAEATGVMDYGEAREQRARDLEEILKGTSDPTARAALRKRVLVLASDRELTGMQLAATQFLGMRASWAFELNGAPRVADPDGQLGGLVGTSQFWSVSLWFGGYDVDALCGYTRGTLSAPFFADGRAGA